MRSGRLLALSVCLAVCAAALAGSVWGHADRASSAGRLVEQQGRSAALAGPLHFAVWLPAGYADRPRRRYPVLYVLHGLPGDDRSYESLSFLVPVLDRLHAQAVVVFPQGATGDESDDEYLDLGPGRDWESAIARELPAIVAHRYRTLPGRDARGIVGISAGGYGAAIIGLHHLDLYRVVESWSGYFHATSPDGSAPLQLPTPAKQAYANAHRLVAGLPRALRGKPTLLAFYSGDHDPYPGFTAENRAFDRELAAAGVPHRFAIYRGAHDNALWLAHADDWIGRALAALSPAR